MKGKPVILVFVLCLLAIFGLCMPAAIAAVPASDGQAQPMITTTELNVTNVSLANATIPAKYQVTPTLIQVGISSNDSDFAGPKGEMAAVPRTIGFSISPELLAIVIVMIAAVGISSWYLLKRKRDGEKKE
ncbi:hypothetical protein [Methanoregula sp.]|jgi:hypothetical protein|uniref:hypothetical protein n=1 Tax=Methanoregula sp. TaxID=2052170 RepID=UPI0035617973